MNNLPSLLLALALAGCASTVVDRQEMHTYRVGQQLHAAVGGTLLVSQRGAVEKVKHWVGVLHSPDGWRIDKRYSEDYVRKELVYSGISGSSMEIGYREYRGGMAAPAFFQNVRYDLSQSRVITFQNFQFEIISATNDQITARLMHD